MARPAPTDAAPFYHKYISYVQGDTIADIISNHAQELLDFYNALPEEKGDYAYFPGKWTVKELFQHVIDAERVFAYRAMRFARKDTTPLAGFDENSYAVNAFSQERSLASLKAEFTALRQANNLMLSTFNDEQLSRSGIASDKPVTVNALAFIMFGHLLHHKNILAERYL